MKPWFTVRALAKGSNDDTMTTKNRNWEIKSLSLLQLWLQIQSKTRISSVLLYITCVAYCDNFVFNRVCWTLFFYNERCLFIEATWQYVWLVWVCLSYKFVVYFWWWWWRLWLKWTTSKWHHWIQHYLLYNNNNNNNNYDHYCSYYFSFMKIYNMLN